MMKKVFTFPGYFNSVFFFILAVIGLSFIFEYDKTFFLLPQSNHLWRQADCASFAMTYYENGMNFFEPKVYNVLAGDGNAVGEFPGLYYLVACFYKIFGPHEIIFRLFFGLIFLAGLVSLFKVVMRLTGDVFFAFFVPLLLFTSPLINFYANNYLCDGPSLSMVFIAWNFILRYRDDQRLKSFWLAILFFLLAGLFKANSAISFAALGGMFFIELVGWTKLKGGSKMFVHLKSNIAGFAIVIAAWVCWYLWAIHYNESHQTSFLGTQSWPGWPIWEATKEDFLSTISMYFLHATYAFAVITCALLLFLTGFVISNRSSFDPFTFGIFLLTLIGVLLFIFLFFVGIRDNIYYIVNLMILPVFIIISSLLILKNKYPQVFSSVIFKIILTAFFAFNVMYAKGMMRVYYHEGKMHYKANNSLYKREFKVFIQSLGIRKQEKVISFPDGTPNVSLYLIGQPGWSGYNVSMDEKSINHCISQGAKYLVLSDLTLLGNSEIMKFTGNCLGNFEGVFVYKLEEEGKNKPGYQYIKIKAQDGKYVYFDGDGDRNLFVSPDSTLGRKFSLIKMEGRNVAIKTEDTGFFSCNLEKNDRMTAGTPWIAKWETFEQVPLPGNRFALKAVNGKYVCIEKAERSFLDAKAEKLQDAASFEVIP